MSLRLRAEILVLVVCASYLAPQLLPNSGDYFRISAQSKSSGKSLCASVFGEISVLQ